MTVPVYPDDVARQLRLRPAEIIGDLADQIDVWIEDATTWIEGYTGHLLAARDVAEQFAGFDRLALAAWPVKADAVPAVTYQAANSAVIDVPAARVSIVRRPAMILPAFGARWPSCCDALVSVTVRAGYEDGDEVPGAIRRAMLILIAAYDADREGGDLFVKAEAAARSICDRANLRLRRL